MTAATGAGTTAQAEFQVTCDGKVISREFQLLAASVTHLANRISRATLVYQDGDPGKGDFRLCSAGVLAPGQTVSISVVAGGVSQKLFEGLTVRQSVRVREHGGSQLTVDCRHAAVRLTAGRRLGVSANVRDADIASRLLKRAGVPCEVRGLTLQHEQFVQPNVSDWRFLVSRARANGCQVLTRVGSIRIERPERREPVATYRFGDGVLVDLEAAQDARRQSRKVTAKRWHFSEQTEEQIERGGVLPDFAGVLPEAALAAVNGSAPVELTDAAATEVVSRSQFESARVDAALSQICGRLRCSQGVAAVLPGDTIRLQSVGKAFSGDVYVTGVRHELDAKQAWRTAVQFGTVDDVADDDGLTQTGSKLPPLAGLHPAVVTETVDPTGDFRVRVRLVLATGLGGLAGETAELWARLATIDAGADRGLMIRPEAGDEVILGFVNGDGSSPVILGMLHSSAHAPPVAPADGNHVKLLKSRSGLMFQLDDRKKELMLGTPGGLQLVFSDQEQSIRLADGAGNTLSMSKAGVEISSAKSLSLQAKIKAELTGGQTASVEGQSLQLSATAEATLKSNTTTKISGTTVLIN